MKWATRATIHIDRAACAWLIRRHLDPDAEFVFVADAAEVPPDATAFDMRGVELSHHHGDCSFETILRGLSMICTDEETLTHTGPIFDGLYEYYRRATLLGREPA
jgi:hypothetical protein